MNIVHFFSLAGFYGDVCEVVGFIAVKQSTLRLSGGWLTAMLDLVDDFANSTFACHRKFIYVIFYTSNSASAAE